jgi:hypothetical protein
VDGPGAGQHAAAGQPLTCSGRDGNGEVVDLGPLFEAVARVNARATERDIYSTLHLKAAALLQTLAKLPCLEHSAEAYLALNGHRLD